MTTKLREGIDAAKRGDKLAARRQLLQVLSGDANNELALMWMASVVDTLSERRFYLERALQVNPGNSRAREALRRLGVEVPDEPSNPGSSSTRTDDLPRIPTGRTNVYLIAAAVVAFAVVAIVVTAVVASLNAANPAVPTPDVQATFAALIANTDRYADARHPRADGNGAAGDHRLARPEPDHAAAELHADLHAAADRDTRAELRRRWR